METLQESDIPIQKVVVLRALQLGDLLCSVPTLRALRDAFPQARITLIGLPWAVDFVHRFAAYVDDFIEFPGFPGLPERQLDSRKFPAFLADVQDRDFDLAIQLHGSGSFVNPLTVLFGARRNAGFYLRGEYCPDPDLFVEYQDSGHEALRLLHVLDGLGIQPQGTYLADPLSQLDHEAYAQLEISYGLQSSPMVCMHPGSRNPTRRWPVEWFAKCARLLAKRGYQVVLTGVREESEITAAVAAQANAQVLDLAGKTDLGVLGVLLSKASFLICNDTGVSHVADALQVPSIVLINTSDPERWAPLDRQLHRLVYWSDSITPEVILEEADQLVQQEQRYVS
jgi:ADP-heptose:LPS heptosyltransferase